MSSLLPVRLVDGSRVGELVTSDGDNSIIYNTNIHENTEECATEENNGVLSIERVKKTVCFDGYSNRSKLDMLN